MDTWAGRNLSKLLGRCRQCGWHVQMQGHDDVCPNQVEIMIKWRTVKI